ncbi:threonine/homoserine/homoserine lactone efflux protein [Litoreibacter ponti]|uniref:Threonine/homoserine/homoserine lactone efflux protein n=1 Tax=Litoreibacter ponti TaxID=1510457 RepID=A0A2T6BH40_9RHOB|nr:LysE family translocator [Litoreibacter ponti]PTX55374.1 threonine/homoserine/homoserine lactone efflux protein [Litoreibacter ponti]
MLNFAAAIFLLLITPGPGVLSLAGVGAAFGFRSGLRYMTGLFLGTNMVALAVVSGLAAVVLASPVIRLILLALSTGYLLYLAARIALAGSNIAFSPAARQPGIRDGLLLQAVNPKAYVVNTTLFAGFALFEDAYLAEVVVKFVIINVIWISIHFLWLWAGASVKRMELAPRTQRIINVGMAAAMLGVVALAGLSAL